MVLDQPGEPEPQKVTIILHSSAYDRVTNALSLAIVSMAMGMEAHIMLTYEGIYRFVKGHFEDIGDTEPAMREMIRRSIDSGVNHSIEEKLATAKDMGLNLYACTNAMATMGLEHEDLVDEVDEIIGLATFIRLSKDASISWYI